MQTSPLRTHSWTPSSRTACSAAPAPSSRTARSFSLLSSRTARSAEPASRQAPRKSHWIPAFAGMTAKGQCRAYLRASSWTTRNVEPAPSSCTPRTCFLMSFRPTRSFSLLSSRTARSAEPAPSSRTARSAEPGSRRGPRKSRWIPAFAGMTAKGQCRAYLRASSWTTRNVEPAPSSCTPRTCFLMSSRTARSAEPALSSRTARSAEPVPSSRTARSAEPGSRRTPRKSHWIPACTGMTQRKTRAVMTRRKACAGTRFARGGGSGRADVTTVVEHARPPRCAS